MATLITHDHLKEIVSAGQIVIGGDPTAVEGIKYDFRLGRKFLKASLERPVDYNDLQGTEKLKVKIEPGEVVFVMSEERLNLPTFPDELVRLIRAYQPINLNSLTEQLGSLKNELTLLQREISEDKKSRTDFKEDLDGLLKALKEEKENRQEQCKQIESKISVIEKDQIADRSARAVWDKLKWALIGAVIAGIIAFCIRYAPQIAKSLFH